MFFSMAELFCLPGVVFNSAGGVLIRRGGFEYAGVVLMARGGCEYAGGGLDTEGWF